MVNNKNNECKIKSNGSFGRGWTTLQRDRRDVYLVEVTFTKEITETEA